MEVVGSHVRGNGVALFFRLFQAKAGLSVSYRSHRLLEVGEQDDQVLEYVYNVSDPGGVPAVARCRRGFGVSLAHFHHRGDGATARSLVEFASDPVFSALAEQTKSDFHPIGYLLSWAIHEIHHEGSAEAREITRAFVEKTARPKPYLQQHFSDDGSRIPRDY